MAQNIKIEQNRKSRWPDIALILILTLLPLLFFWRLITPNPADRMHIAAGDFTEQYFPLRAFAAQEWSQGRVPLWNPYLYGGQPALADIQSGALYPPHVIESLALSWGGSLLDREIGFPLWALEWQIIAHFSLAAAGTYLFARHIGRQSGASRRRARFAGVIASLVFTYGGYLTGFPVQQMTILEVSAWLPWVLWGLSAGSRQPGEWTSVPQPGSRPRRFSLLLSPVTRSPAATAWAALAFALAILAGHPQTVLYIFYLTLAYAAFLAFCLWRDRPPPPSPVRPASPVPLWGPVVNWLVVVLLGAAVAAAQLLPTLEFIARSVRADMSYRAVSAGLPLNELVAMLYPGFFGGSPEYVGIATLVLIALALVLARPRRAVYFWAGAGLVGLLLAFGDNTFLYSIFYLAAPGFEAVRQQERAFLVYSFSAAMLAGYGVLAVTGPFPKSTRRRFVRLERRLRVAAGVALAATAFFIYGSGVATARGDEVNLFYGVLRHHLFGLIILVGILLLLALRPRRWLRRPWGMGLVALWLAFNLFTVNWRFNLEKPAGPAPFAANNVTQFLQSTLSPTEPARVVSGGLLPGGNSAASVYELPDLTGNTPLQLAAVADFFQQMPAWRMWQLMNVRYVVDNRDIAGEGLTKVFAGDEFSVFEVGDPFPRARFVRDTEVIPEDGPALARLSADDFDLRRAAIVTRPLFDAPGAASLSPATVVNFSPTRMTITAEETSDQLLVVSQVYYPGWQARLDGRPVELLRVNVIQQGVLVPAGQHTVELVFQPVSFWVGGVVSIVALLVAGGLLLARGVQ